MSGQSVVVVPDDLDVVDEDCLHVVVLLGIVADGYEAVQRDVGFVIDDEVILLDQPITRLG